MSWYTTGEIFVWMIIAAILGFVLAWLIQARRLTRYDEREDEDVEYWYEDDDLREVHGIGEVISEVLYSIGISSFHQIANFTDNDITTVEQALKIFPGRIKRDDWIGSARDLHIEKYGDDPAEIPDDPVEILDEQASMDRQARVDEKARV